MTWKRSRNAAEAVVRLAQMSERVFITITRVATPTVLCEACKGVELARIRFVYALLATSSHKATLLPWSTVAVTLTRTVETDSMETMGIWAACSSSIATVVSWAAFAWQLPTVGMQWWRTLGRYVVALNLAVVATTERTLVCVPLRAVCANDASLVHAVVIANEITHWIIMRIAVDGNNDSLHVRGRGSHSCTTGQVNTTLRKRIYNAAPCVNSTVVGTAI